MNEPNPNGVRIPKGILKNSGRATSYGAPPETIPDYGGSAPGYMNQPPPYQQHHGMPPGYPPPHAIPGYHTQPLPVYPGDYGALPSGHIPPPVHPPPHQAYITPMSSQWTHQYYETGLNPPPQRVPPPIEEVPTFRRKLERLMTRKRDLILRPLATEEKPLLQSRLEEKKSEGSYGITPSIDNYLPLDSSDRKEEFFKTVKVGDIVVGEVYSKNSSGLTFRLLSFDGGKRAHLEDLSIKGHCPPSQIVPLDPSDPDKVYEEDDRARLEVLEVNAESRKLVLGMKGVKISNEMRHAFPLGPVANEDLPREYIMTKIEGKSRRKRSYEEVLDSSSGFHNPNSIACLGTSLGIFSNKNSFMLGLSGSFPRKDMASDLRSAQNAKWAQQNVALGIRHFKQGNQVEAFQCLNKAIIIDPQNVEGLVARGALNANNGSFEKALEDFEAALKNAPEHFNGRKYMAETLVVVGKNKQEQGKIEDALTSYAKCLAMLPEHKEAILSLMSVHEEIEKIDISRLSSTTLTKMSEVKEKLRTMIAEEIAKKKLGYYEKMGTGGSASVKQEKRSSESGSSSSDSSDSESDSSSGDEFGRKEKKRKSKKRKKKSKKSKRSSKSSKAGSLSPFSKKLAGPDVSGSRLSGSSYDWNQQIGINKLAVPSGSDVESSKKSKEKKHSKKRKEKKKKKKRDSSNSSDTDASEKRAKKEKPKLITDFGEIEEQLTAYFSKCEQGKTDKKSEAHVPLQAVKVTVKQNVHKDYDPYDNSTRRIELVQDELPRRDRDSTRFSYKNDEGNNFPHSQTIIRTVQNDKTVHAVGASSTVLAAPATDTSASEPVAKAPATKWRTIGSADTSYSLSTLGPVVAPPKPSAAAAAPAVTKPEPTVNRELPFALAVDKLKPRESEPKPERNYRSKSTRRSRSRSLSKSRSRSRSRSRSSSHSPGYRRIRRSRAFSRSPHRRRSYSRSRSRSKSPLRHRSRSGSPRRRFRDGYGGRGQRGLGGGRRGSGGRQFPPVVRISRFRNRFSHSRSRSGSKGRKVSKSPDRKRDSRPQQRSSTKRHSPSQQSKSEATESTRKEHSNQKGGGDGNVKPKSTSPTGSRKSHAEMKVLGLSTNKVSEVEKLLDKHKAQKKEEMRERNPEFFRNSQK